MTNSHLSTYGAEFAIQVEERRMSVTQGLEQVVDDVLNDDVPPFDPNLVETTPVTTEESAAAQRAARPPPRRLPSRRAAAPAAPAAPPPPPPPAGGCASSRRWR